eukprot:1873980-Prymnesium_polylepis.2
MLACSPRYDAEPEEGAKPPGVSPWPLARAVTAVPSSKDRRLHVPRLVCVVGIALRPPCGRSVNGVIIIPGRRTGGW